VAAAVGTLLLAAAPVLAGDATPDQAFGTGDGTRVVLRMAVSGGFVPVEVIDTTLPAFTLYADGTAIYLPLPAPWPDPGEPLPPLRVARLTAQQVDELVAFAVDHAGLGSASEMYWDPRVMDAQFTVFDLDVPGLTKQVTVYALGIREDAPDAADRARLAELADRLGSFDTQSAAGGAQLEGDYRPDRYRGVLRPVSSGSPEPAAPWPFDDLSTVDFVGTVYRKYAELRPDQVALVTAEPNGGITDLRLRAPDGTEHDLAIRPLLPDERAIPSDAVPRNDALRDRWL
jgi:hypothetical protein